MDVKIKEMPAAIQAIEGFRGVDPVLGRVASMLLLKERPQALAFIAARSGEGTSTVSRDLTRLLSHLGFKVLLLNHDSPEQSRQASESSYAIDVFASGQKLQMMFCRAESTPYHELYLSGHRNPGLAARIAASAEFLRELKEVYDYLVIDGPALEKTFEGVALAARADGVIILVEAEATHGTAVANLRTALEDVGANILGIIMTKQRSYASARIRRRF